MNKITIVYLVLGLLLLARSFFSYIYPLIKEIIRIHLTPTDYISALPLAGQVEVIGKTGHETIPSLLTQKACVLWQIVVQESSMPDIQPRGILATFIRSLERSDWVTTHIEISPEPFDVHDGTGKIRVLPAGAYLILRDNRESSSLFPLDLQIRNILERLGIETTDHLGNDRTLRVFEQVIGSAEEIYVLGEIIYGNGVKTLATKEGIPPIISDRSQRELLGKLYRDVGARIFLAALTFLIFLGFLNAFWVF